MDKLTELGLQYGTDKAFYHQFTSFYDSFLESKREQIKWAMEIGVLNNSSLRMWEDYFPNATIVGVDNQDKSQYEEDRIKIFLADQGDNEQLLNVVKNTTTAYDVIIDDGSHLIDHQMTTLGFLFPYVKDGGIYILEDLHTSHFDLFPDWDKPGIEITALQAIESLRDGNFNAQYLEPHQKEYIEETVDKVHIFYRDGGRESITAIIIKK